MRFIYRSILLLLLAALTIGATGCSITKKQTSQTDGGFYASTDFGENWKQKVFVNKEKNGIRTIASVGTKKMIFDPLTRSRVYLLSSANGIYVSSNRGEQWTPTGLSTGSYVDLSIDYRNNAVLYATQGTKILKSVDEGVRWSEIYTETRPDQKLVSVQVSPTNSPIVYAASNGGILKSTDYGNTWKLLDWTMPAITQLRVSERSGNTLYALTSSGIYKSTDGAQTWNIITDPLKNFPGALKILWFNFDQRNEHIILGTAYGVLRSTDGGSTWNEIPTLFDFKKVPIVAVIDHPNDLNRIVFAVKNVLHKTDDGGLTWKTIKTVGTSRSINYLINDPEIVDSIYVGTQEPPKK
ncbi:MAG: hypothetical protein HZC01_05050 [Candidatus Kerfeldbacteria bacterium]|nr:hypothetical protein [Candidatus Kerfeldbacteria bacterium]